MFDREYWADPFQVLTGLVWFFLGIGVGFLACMVLLP